jgi:O-antigen/teichoic acid export membrane protein
MGANLLNKFGTSKLFVYFCSIIMDNLKEKTAKGLFWGALNNGTMQVLNLLIGIIVLNRLTPEDTGLIGMLAIFSAIAGNLQSSGFSTALINEKEPTAQQYNSVFWFNILMGGSLYALLFLSAPLIAMFFHQPRLTDLSRFLFLSFFISSFGISTNAYLVKNMMNREITIVNLTALLISGSTAIVLALNGWAYWSLAWQQVVNSTVLILGRFYYVKWKPSLKFSFDYIRQTFSFSMKILVTMIVNTVNQNLLTVIFGRLFRDARVVGNFFQAYKWDSMAFQTVGGMVGQVAQPVLVSVREEKDRELNVFRKMLRFTSFLSFPILFGLALVAPEFIVVLVGEKWLPSAELMQLLCIAGAFMPITTLYSNFMISRNRSDVYMWNILSQGLIVLGTLCAVKAFQLSFCVPLPALLETAEGWSMALLPHSLSGIRLMVVGYVVIYIAWLFLWHFFLWKEIRLNLWAVLKDILPFVGIATLVMGLTYLCTRTIEHRLVLLLTRMLVAAILYLAILWLLKAKILRESLSYLTKRKAHHAS